MERMMSDRGHEMPRSERELLSRLGHYLYLPGGPGLFPLAVPAYPIERRPPEVERRRTPARPARRAATGKTECRLGVWLQKWAHRVRKAGGS